MAIEEFAVTVPTLPDAATPVSAMVILGVTVPTFPVADTPVSATVTACPERALNGADENAEIPNMVYGITPPPH
jgi:hypothetical protein